MSKVLIFAVRESSDGNPCQRAHSVCGVTRSSAAAVSDFFLHLVFSMVGLPKLSAAVILSALALDARISRQACIQIGCTSPLPSGFP